MSMRHWLWYRTDGTLGGFEASTHGVPSSLDPNDANSQDPWVLFVRSQRIGVDGHAGWLSYDCACDHEECLFCPCPSERVRDSYVNGGALVTKPGTMASLLCVVNGVNRTPHIDVNSPLNVVPGSSVTFKLVCPSIPDGHQVQAFCAGSADVMAESPVTFTFNGGTTNQITLVAPAQGLVGGIGFYSKLILPMRFFLRGWPA